MIAAELFRQRTLRPHLFLNLLDVIEVIGKRGMNVSERDGGNVGDNLVGSHALVLMPHYDVEHTDAMSCNASPASADALPPDNPLRRGIVHNSSIAADDEPSSFWRGAHRLKPVLPSADHS